MLISKAQSGLVTAKKRDSGSYGEAAGCKFWQPGLVNIRHIGSDRMAMSGSVIVRSLMNFE